MDQPKTDQLTDLGNTRRLVAAHGRDLLFCRALGWLKWDGRYWRPDETGAVVRDAKATVISLWDEVKAADSESEQRKASAWAIKSQNVNRIKAIIALAETEREIAIPVSAFDNHPFLLNCLNGTLDLRIGKLREHDRADLITKIAPVEYDADADCPRWLQFLDEIMDGDHDKVAFLQRAVGYSLTGDVSEQVIVFLHGQGANGKSTFLIILLGLLGSYGWQAAPKLLVVTKNERHPTEIADLFGRRLVVCTEVGQRERFDEVQLKQLTGGDRSTGRRMRRDFFQFDPTHKLFLAANHKPAILGTDPAIWRRICLVPFNVTIPDSKRDKQLVQKLEAERSGILRWAVQGCLDWQASGLQPPSSVLAATEDYRSEEDRLNGFLEDCCVVGGGLQCSAADLYGSYVEWCESNRENALTQKWFGKSLSGRGLERKKTGKSRRWGWFGIGLLDRVNPSEPTSPISSSARARVGQTSRWVHKGSPPGELNVCDGDSQTSASSTEADSRRSPHADGAPPRPCRACKSTKLWRSTHGVVSCLLCHPPAAPGLVAERLEVEANVD